MKRQEKIFNYIKSHQERSTLIGKIISVNHTDDDDDKIMEFSEWMDEFVRKAEKYSLENK